MTAFVDTTMVVRYLTGDPPDQARTAASILDGVELLITDVVLVESAYVLRSFYDVPRDVIVDHLIALVRKANISPFAMDEGSVIDALLMCRGSGRVSFADAMIWAAAHSSGAEAVYSLNRRFPEVDVTVRREPA